MLLHLLFYFVILLYNCFIIKQKLYKTVLFFLLMNLYLKVNDYTFRSCFSLILKVSCSFKTSFISSFNIH